MPDPLDVRILHALQIDGRAPFSLIARVLGVSDQTVARRYNRLHSTGRLRVRGLVEPSATGRTQLIVRIRCTPSTATTIADTLARRVDTCWISLTAGGTDIVCVVAESGSGDRSTALLGRLARSRGVVRIDAHHVLHEFFGGAQGLITKNGPLSREQVDALRSAEVERRPGGPAMEEGDHRLLEALEQDGRLPVTSLAVATGWSPSTVRRRLAALLAAGLIYFDVDVDQAVFDRPIRAVMWLLAPVDHLEAVGRTLADHPEVGYVAATTGPTNLYAAVSCATDGELYRYLTERVARMNAVQHVETAPITSMIKSSGVLPTR